MIYYVCPERPESSLSGGVRKHGDHVAILRANGIKAVVVSPETLRHVMWNERALAVIPEVYGQALRTLAPDGIRRVAWVQNGYLIELDPEMRGKPHPFVTTPDLVAVMTESDHTTELVKLRCPDLAVPIIRTHSSGNGRMGELGPFRFGPWPREKWVMHFDYKVKRANALVLDGLELPPGWRPYPLSGLPDDSIADCLRRGAIFLAPNAVEGMCAPTSEAMISGAIIVGWPGGPSEFAPYGTPDWAWAMAARPGELVGGPMEYLAGRAGIAPQDDVGALRDAVLNLALQIDEDPVWFARHAEAASDYFQATYSREREIQEICAIMRDLHG